MSSPQPVALIAFLFDTLRRYAVEKYRVLALCLAFGLGLGFGGVNLQAILLVWPAGRDRWLALAITNLAVVAVPFSVWLWSRRVEPDETRSASRLYWRSAIGCALGGWAIGPFLFHVLRVGV
jgi:hypothetical protein